MSRLACIVVCAALAVLCIPAGAQEIRPSFDCRKARFPDERAICDDDHLAQMDQAATIALGQVQKDLASDARATVVDQLKDRHACGSNRLCILDNQAALIEALRGDGAKVPVPPWVGAYRLSLVDNGLVPMVAGLPKQTGTCTRTKISGLGSRFGDTLKPPEGDNDPGTSVDFADEGHQVSYTYDAAAAASAIGDAVLLCLVSLPRDCPPGDDRGKVYSATNLRTRGSWIMSDSQHMCGGA